MGVCLPTSDQTFGADMLPRLSQSEYRSVIAIWLKEHEG